MDKKMGDRMSPRRTGTRCSSYGGVAREGFGSVGLFFSLVPTGTSALPGRGLLPALEGEADAGGFVQGFLVFLLGVGVRDDAGSDLIDQAVAVADECADGDVE